MRVWRGDGTPVDVTVTGLSRTDWSILVQEHPPRPGEQLWCEDTFPPALIAACTSKTVAEATEWWDESPTDAAEEMFSECLRVSSPGQFDWAVRRLRRNSRLASEVSLCVQMGIAHSVFCGWSGRDQDLALASALIARDCCPGCGAPEAAMSNPARAEIKVKACLMCQGKAATSDAIPESERGHTHVFVIPVGGA